VYPDRAYRNDETLHERERARNGRRLNVDLLHSQAATRMPDQQRQDGVTRPLAMARLTHLAHFNHKLLQPPDLAERDALINFWVAVTEALVQLAAKVVRPHVGNERGLWQDREV